MAEISSGLRASALAIAVNAALAAGKIVTGIIGNSYALIADGIESTADIISSVIVWSGLRLSAKPPDAEHPYGHGKAEPIAAMPTRQLSAADEYLRGDDGGVWSSQSTTSSISPSAPMSTSSLHPRTATRACATR